MSSKILGGIRTDWNGKVTLVMTDGTEAERHDYVPSAMHMGDCATCGNVSHSPFHNPPYYEVPSGMTISPAEQRAAVPNDIIPTDPMRNAVAPANERKGDWIQTFTGRQFWPLDPRADEVCIEDIAHALAHQCRYGGHTKRFYSVAEHCCHLATIAPPYLKLIALMHDAAEAYLVDVPRPIKKSLAVYYDIEREIEQAVAKHFGLVHPWHHIVMELDTRICTDERQQLMATPPIPWSGVVIG